MSAWKALLAGIFVASFMNVPASYAIGRDCPPEFNTVDFGIQSATLQLKPRGTRLRVVFNNRFILDDHGPACVETEERLGNDGLPIPVVRAVTFKTDVLRRPVVGFGLKAHTHAMSVHQSALMVQVLEDGIEADRLSEAEGLDIIRPVGNGACHESVHGHDGISCIVNNPFIADGRIPVFCEVGSCAAKLIPISHGLTMGLTWETDGTSAEAMAAEVDPKLAEAYVFLSALIMP